MAQSTSHTETTETREGVSATALPSAMADIGGQISSPQAPPSSQNMPEATVDTAANALTVANRLRPILLRLHRYLRNEAHDVGVTGIQASLLAAISRTPGIGLGELAQREHVTTPTLVAHIDRLETAGLVARARMDSGDRRRVSLSVTVAGQAAIEMLRERRTAWLATRLATLSPEEIAQVADAIEPLSRLVE